MGRVRTALLVTLALLGPAACGDDEALHLDRLAREHLGDRGDVPGAAAAVPAAPGSEPGLPIRAEPVEYGEGAAAPLRGYLARPAEPARGGPGVLVIHEWWGLNDNIRSVTRRLAAQGYTALAVDLYEGGHSADPGEARLLATQASRRAHRVEANLLQAHAYLRERQGTLRVGVVGWCFGGGWALRTALLLPDQIDATVIYYGRVVTEPSRLAPLSMPILGIFAGRDRAIPLSQVREFERVLEDLGKRARILVYEDADHAFANPSGDRYEPEAAARAWAETVAFLGEHLGGTRPGEAAAGAP